MKKICFLNAWKTYTVNVKFTNLRREFLHIKRVIDYIVKQKFTRHLKIILFSN